MMERALECDTEARGATAEGLTTLMALRQSAVMTTANGHPHHETIVAARNSVEREIRFRLAKAEEYQQMAAIVCLKLDMLHDMKNSLHLKEQVELAKEDKDKLIADPKQRQQQYAAMSALFNLPKA